VGSAFRGRSRASARPHRREHRCAGWKAGGRLESLTPPGSNQRVIKEFGGEFGLARNTRSAQRAEFEKPLTELVRLTRVQS